MRNSLALLVALVLALTPSALAAPPPSLTESISPAPQAEGRYFNAHPLSHYALDYHVDGPQAGIGLGGIDFDVSGIPALIAQFLAAQIWEVTKFLVNAVIELFTWAFSLDLLNGSRDTGGAGTLDPISKAITSLHENVLGRVWMSAAIVLAGMWGIWKALVQRRYSEGLGSLAVSVLFVVIALFLVNEPQATIGQASRWTSQLSLALLSGTSTGSLENGGRAKAQAADQLFKTLIHDPWIVLNFGAGKDSQALARRWLEHPPGSPERDAEYQRLAGAPAQPVAPPLLPPPAHGKGKKDDPPQPDPVVTPPEPSDSAAVAIQGKAGAFERLTVAAVVFAGDLGAVVLIGFLSLAVLLTQVLALMLLAFAPVALVIAVFPGRGHDFFRGWLAKLATAIVIKAIYSLTIAVVLAVAAALTTATGELGFLLSFGLECAFFWAVFVYRKQLAARAVMATAGPGGLSDRGPGRSRAVQRTVLSAAHPVRSIASAARNGGRRVMTGSRPPDQSHAPSHRPGPTGRQQTTRKTKEQPPTRNKPKTPELKPTSRSPHTAKRTTSRKPPADGRNATERPERKLPRSSGTNGTRQPTKRKPARAASRPKPSINPSPTPRELHERSAARSKDQPKGPIGPPPSH